MFKTIVAKDSEDEENVTVFITKYALTRGISNLTGRIVHGDLFVLDGRPPVYFDVNDWHRTWPEAKERAEEMRTKKLLSIAEEIKRISSITFDLGVNHERQAN